MLTMLLMDYFLHMPRCLDKAMRTGEEVMKERIDGHRTSYLNCNNFSVIVKWESKLFFKTNELEDCYDVNL